MTPQSDSLISPSPASGRATTPLDFRARPSLKPTWRELLILTLLVAVASLLLWQVWGQAIDLYFAKVPKIGALPAGPRKFLRAFAISFNAAQAWVLGAAGLWFAARISLAPFDFLTLRARNDLRQRLRTLLVRSLWLGVALFVISSSSVFLQWMTFGATPPFGTSAGEIAKHQQMIALMTKAFSLRGMIGLMFGIPIIEEVEFRLFLMSLIVWLGARIVPASHYRSRSLTLSIGIIVSGFAFGFLHVIGRQSLAWWLPLYSQLFFDPRTYIGIVLGYAYWRWGLESSIGAHCMLNVLAIGGTRLSMLL